MKIYFKNGNASFFGMDVLPEDTMEQVTHKIQDKGQIKSCNLSLSMVDSFCKNIITDSWMLHNVSFCTFFVR